MNLKGAIQKLQDFRRLSSPRSAIACLRGIQTHTRIALLFQHFFPDRYQAVGFDLAQRNGELSKAEMDFFELVNEHLFPVNTWSVEEEFLNCEPGEFGAIAIEPQGYIIAGDEDLEVEIGHFAYPVNLLLFLIYINLEEESGKLWNWLMSEIEQDLHGETIPKPSMLEHWEDWVYVKDYVDFVQIEEAFESDPVLKDIGVVLKVLSQNTENIWLDYDPYEYGYGECILLETDQFEWYAEEWGKAQELIEITNGVLNEFKNHPDRLVEFIQAWDAATVWNSKKESEDVRPTD